MTSLTVVAASQRPGFRPQGSRVGRDDQLVGVVATDVIGVGHGPAGVVVAKVVARCAPVASTVIATCQQEALMQLGRVSMGRGG